jgi:peptidoglycan/LPS O-acetylase OafA/YrhL
MAHVLTRPLDSGSSTVSPAAPTTRTPRRAAGRLRAVDGLRLVAALLVALYHYLAVDAAEPAWGQSAGSVFPQADFIAPYGWLGVEAFFIISGFVICMSCWGRTVGQFFRSRVVRLYPAYWAAVLLTFTVISITPVVTPPPTFGEAAVNLTMFQGPLSVDLVDGVYWTLWAEMRFYLLFALVMWHGLTYRRVLAFCLIWTIAAPVSAGQDLWVLQVIAMPKYGHYFLVGVGLYLVYRYGHRLLSWLVIGVNFVLSVHYAIIRMEHQEVDVVFQDLHEWVVVAILAGTVLFLLAAARGHLDWVRWNWVSSAGALTYPFYLLHGGIGFVIIYWLYERLEWSAHIVLPLTLAATLLLAWLVHRFVERPLAAWLDARLRDAGRGLPLDPPDLLSGAPAPAPTDSSARTAARADLAHTVRIPAQAGASANQREPLVPAGS